MTANINITTTLVSTPRRDDKNLRDGRDEIVKCKFPLHDGTIKTGADAERVAFTEEFPLHDGTIKTILPMYNLQAPSEFPLHDGTIKTMDGLSIVRTGIGFPLHDGTIKTNAVIAAAWERLVFPLHDGTIKTRRYGDAFPKLSVVSTPRRDDKNSAYCRRSAEAEGGFHSTTGR